MLVKFSKREETDMNLNVDVLASNIKNAKNKTNERIDNFLYLVLINLIEQNNQSEVDEVSEICSHFNNGECGVSELILGCINTVGVTEELKKAGRNIIREVDEMLSKDATVKNALFRKLRTTAKELKGALTEREYTSYVDEVVSVIEDNMDNISYDNISGIKSIMEFHKANGFDGDVQMKKEKLNDLASSLYIGLGQCGLAARIKDSYKEIDDDCDDWVDAAERVDIWNAMDAHLFNQIVLGKPVCTVGLHSSRVV